MKTFFNGLTLIVPTAVIIYILIWVLKTTESFFGGMILLGLPEAYYVSGMGLAAGVVIIFTTGLLLKFWIVRKVQGFFEEMIEETPLVGAVYGGMKDFFNFFSNLKKRNNGIVVLVDIPAFEAKMLGFMTVESFDRFEILEMEEPVVVYLQMSYQLGGYSLMIPKKHLTPIDMDVEEAMRFIMTAGISGTAKQE